MSNAETTGHKQRIVGTPFRPGVSGNPAGRPKGSRNRLAEDFVANLADAWQEHGATALAICAKTEPAQFCRIIASLMPKDINISGQIDVVAFASKFEAALELLGNRPRSKLIEHNDG
jgi:hypothetical protein